MSVSRHSISLSDANSVSVGRTSGRRVELVVPAGKCIELYEIPNKKADRRKSLGKRTRARRSPFLVIKLANLNQRGVVWVVGSLRLGDRGSEVFDQSDGRSICQSHTQCAGDENQDSHKLQ
jgi:hypothetical protein